MMQYLRIILPLLLFPSACWAAESTSESVPELTVSAGLTYIDWGILVLYAAGTIALGRYFSRRQTMKEYFVGTGRMSPILIGVSLFATLLSTISYLMYPGEALGKGPVVIVKLLSYPFVYLFAGFVLLPVLMRQKVTSAYELLESRLGGSIRMLGALMFLIMRLIWMSLLIHVAAEAMVVVLGVDESMSLWITIISVSVAIAYTSLGGLRAVVITDLIQTILLFGGALLVLAIITFEMRGFGWFPTEWQDNWDTQPVFGFDPSIRVTMFGTVLLFFVWYICTLGGDQVSVQRFMATTDARAARRSLAIQLVASTLVSILLILVGFALLGYFKANPDLLGSKLSLEVKDDADKIFPYFISTHLPVGVAGLVVSALFAAAMSSVDSGVNSFTAVFVTDVLERFGIGRKTEGARVLTARLIAVAIGVIVVLLSSLIQYVPGNVMGVVFKTANLLVAPIFGLFFFAFFVPFAKPVGVWVATICSLTTAVLVAFSGPIFGYRDPETKLDPVSFQWIMPAALVVSIVVGTAISWLLPSRKEPGTA